MSNLDQKTHPVRPDLNSGGMEGQKGFFKPQTGVLYIVSTPIGNLKDITLRALEVLSSVELIAAEDTRRTRILLSHYNIQTPTTSYYEFNKEKKTPFLIEKLKAGGSVALVSDAGTPGISDPAFYLIREALGEAIAVTMVPGATAFVPALILSGLPTDRFVFEGFLPVKKGRQKRLQELTEEKRTIIFYESPRRLLKTLNEFLSYFGDRKVALVKELTKKFEQIYRGKISQVRAQLTEQQPKGEWIIVLEGKGK